MNFSYLFLKFSKAYNFGKLQRTEMELTLLLTLIYAIQNDINVIGQISV